MNTTYKILICFVSIIFIFTASISAQSSISVIGVASNNEGFAGWNADGTGSEPAKTGHGDLIIGGVTYFYLASRDYGKIDPTDGAAGFHAVAFNNGFDKFKAALSANSLSLNTLKFKGGLASLGNDIQGSDWIISGNVETRFYKGGSFVLQLNNQDMVKGVFPKGSLVLNYNPPMMFSFSTEYTFVTDASQNSSDGIKAAAAAFLTDINNLGIRFVFDNILPGEKFTGNGRTGTFYNLASGRIEKASLIDPVELSSFTSSLKGNCVVLTWQTATEINNNGFGIERSNDNSIWIPAGFVPGYGTTSQMQRYTFTDNNLAAGKYFYRLKQSDYDGTSKYYPLNTAVEVTSPFKFELLQNFPNPFNPSTEICYQVPTDNFVSLKVYNTTGQLVSTLVNGVKKAGSYGITFDASMFSSGVYYGILKAGINSTLMKTVKMLLIK